MMHQSLTDDWWKTLTNLVKIWSNAALPIDHQNYEYTQAHELVVNKKTTFCKQYRSGNCCPDFRGHSLINNWRRAISWSAWQRSCSRIDIASIECIFVEREIQSEPIEALGTQNSFNEIRPCYPNAYNKGGCGVCKLKSAGDWLMDAANFTAKTNDLYVAKQRYSFSGVEHIRGTY